MMDKIDFIPAVPSVPDNLGDQLKVHSFTVTVYPKLFQNFPSIAKLKWKSVEFSKNAIKRIPEIRGIYALVLVPLASEFPMHKIIMYIGQTGHQSNANLRKRFQHYLRGKDDRVKIRRLFGKWGQMVRFYFVPLPDPTLNLDSIEKTINSTLVPWGNERDYTAIMGRAVRVLRA